MRNFDLSPLMRQWIGFDKLANALQNAGESQSQCAQIPNLEFLNHSGTL